MTWNYFFHSPPPSIAVTTIGDYDSWRLQTAPTCFEFYEGLKMEDTRPESDIWLSLLDPTVIKPLLFEQIVKNGRMIIKYRDNYCESIANQFGYETTISLNGSLQVGVLSRHWRKTHIQYHAFAMNVFRFGSKQFGARFDKYDLCIAYIFDGYKFTVSLYSEKVDVSVIAKSYGGGGHKGAAGFVCEKLPFVPIPY